MNKIKQLDLHHLVALAVLLRERSVKPAAEILGLSQSGVSKSLKFLRDYFNDPLLVRGSGGMVLTPLAEELSKPLKHSLVDLQHTIQRLDKFHPEKSQLDFTMMAVDHVECTLLPALSRTVAKEAPGIGLNVKPLDRRGLYDALETGKAHVAVGIFSDKIQGLVRETLYSDHFVTLVRKDHPRIDKTLNLDHFVNEGHILVSPKGSGPSIVDLALQDQNLSRKITMRIPHFQCAPLQVVATDYLVTMPRMTAMSLAEYLPIQLFKPPVVLPRFEVVQLWHERFVGDSAHSWFREKLKESAARLNTDDEDENA